MLWLALQAGMAQAHTALDAGHWGEPAVQALAHASQPEANAGEHCNLAHCGHALGLPLMPPEAAAAPDGASAPACVPRLFSRLAPHEVERPKWTAATPV